MSDQIVSSETGFLIVAPYGEGTSSIVYKAIKKDKSGHIHQEVALKVFNEGSKVSSWQREYKSLCKVNSPRCVRVFSFEWVFDKPAICLEWVDGVPLSELLSRGQLGETQLLDIAAQVYKGLKDLWANDLLHGDLSPKNVMVNRAGLVKLLDFGLGNVSGETRYGTPMFTHPEVLRGADASRGMDIYSLGQLLNWSSQRINPPGEKLHEIGSELVRDPTEHNSALESLEENSSAREELAVSVGRLVSEKEAGLQETQEYFVKSQVIDYGKELPSLESTSPLHKIQRREKVAIAAITAVVVSFGAFFVLKEINFGEPLKAMRPFAAAKGTIQIRTSQWKQIWLDGKLKGYTPANLLDVDAGEHSIKWVGADSAGEFTLTLSDGETKLLTDEAFQSKEE